jgi:hypothetical protein
MNIVRRALPVLLVAASLSAQTYDKILLPIQPSTLNGAFNSSWHTLLAEQSDDDATVQLKCNVPVCVPIAPHGSVIVQSNASADPAFIYVPSAQSAHVHFALRTVVINDTARPMMDIPLARAADFTASVLHLQAIPFNRDYRQSLRIFDLDGLDGATVRVRIFTTSTDPVVDTVLVLHRPSSPDVDGRPGAPAYAAVHNLAQTFPAIGNADLAAIDIEPLTPGMQIWAFVTSTNNVTQQFNHFVN